VGGACSTHGRGEKLIQDFSGKARRQNTLEEEGVDGRMGSKWTLGRSAGGVWSGLTWLRIGIISRLL
jgi:hypothetical protein